jgi:hypothetical protein
LNRRPKRSKAIMPLVSILKKTVPYIQEYLPAIKEPARQ